MSLGWECTQNILVGDVLGVVLRLTTLDGYYHWLVLVTIMRMAARCQLAEKGRRGQDGGADKEVVATKLITIMSTVTITLV